MNVILEQYYGLTNCSFETLEGYESINFKVKADSDTFVLKKYNFSEETIAILKAEDQVAHKLNEIEQLNFPESIHNIEEHPITIVDGFIYRLLPFIEGEFLAEILKDEVLLVSFGTALGNIDKILLGLSLIHI